MNWNDVAQDRDTWRSLVNAVIKLDSTKCGEIFV
jgi:hypothetical protein